MSVVRRCEYVSIPGREAVREPSITPTVESTEGIDDPRRAKWRSHREDVLALADALRQ